MKTKICSKCNKEKALDKFVKDNRKKDGTRNYCKECYNLQKRKTPLKPKAKDGFKICAKCNKELLLSEFNIRTINGKRTSFPYCKECEHNYDKNRYKHICQECGKEYRSGRKDSKICRECYNKYFAELGKENLKILNENQFGENNHMYGVHRFGQDNPNYNSDKTDEEREKGRLISGYGIWRDKVYKRDNYTCVCCGYDKGHILKAHHLDSWDWCKDKRLEIANGVTFCDKCHKEFHDNYGYGNNTKEQFYEFRRLKINK